MELPNFFYLILVSFHAPQLGQLHLGLRGLARLHCVRPGEDLALGLAHRLSWLSRITSQSSALQYMNA